MVEHNNEAAFEVIIIVRLSLYNFRSFVFKYSMASSRETKRSLKAINPSDLTFRIGHGSESSGQLLFSSS